MGQFISGDKYNLVVEHWNCSCKDEGKYSLWCVQVERRFMVGGIGAMFRWQRSPAKSRFLVL